MSKDRTTHKEATRPVIRATDVDTFKPLSKDESIARAKRTLGEKGKHQPGDVLNADPALRYRFMMPFELKEGEKRALRDKWTSLGFWRLGPDCKEYVRECTTAEIWACHVETARELLDARKRTNRANAQRRLRKLERETQHARSSA